MARGHSSGPPRRRASRPDTRKQLLLFVEGARTETDYFKHYHRLHRERVIVTIDEFHGGPVQLVDRAITAKKEQSYEARHGRGRPYDEIWCVFDVDDRPNWHDAVEQAAQGGIEVAVSNPCVEFWFILHYQDQTAHIDRRQAQKRAEALMQCSKVLTQQALDSLTDRYPDAVKRAVRLDEKHRKDGSAPRTNPSSDTWRLIDRIKNEGS